MNETQRIASFYLKRTNLYYYIGELIARRKLLRLILRSQSRKILGIGSARSFIEDFLARLGREVIASDINVHLLRSIKKRLRNHKLDFIITDARHLPFVSSSFDLVFSQGLLEHFKDTSEILSEQLRAAKSCLIDVPLKGYSLSRDEKKVFGEVYLKPSEEWMKELSVFGKTMIFPYSKGSECVFLIE